MKPRPEFRFWVAEHERFIFSTDIEKLSKFFDSFEFYSNRPRQLEQFSGCYDTRGRMLWEGDAVECVHEEGYAWKKVYQSIGVIVFSEGAFMIKCLKKGHENAKGETKRHFYLHFSAKRKITKLGNIHQNPELLPITGF